MTIWTRKFWQATAERAASTAAQSALLIIGAEQVNAISGVEWTTVGGFALGGAALAVLKAVAASQVGGPGPSLTDAETLRPIKPRLDGWGDGI